MTETPDLMNTREVARYLHVRERKIYDLVRQRAIPHSRVVGKLLFPRALIDHWVIRNRVSLPEAQAEFAPPPVIAGSHDPLLEWAARESECGLALLAGGSLDGVRRLAQGQARIAGSHVFDAASGEFNLSLLEMLEPVPELVILEWAKRQQGLILARGNPLAIAGLSDVKRTGARVIDRQPDAGSYVLLRHLMREAGLTSADLAFTRLAARTHVDLATAVLRGEADCGLGIRSVAQDFALDFLPLFEERYDLILSRRDVFEPPMQTLMSLVRSPRFARQAASMGGYDVSATGRVVYNRP